MGLFCRIVFSGPVSCEISLRKSTAISGAMFHVKPFSPTPLAPAMFHVKHFCVIRQSD